MSAAKLYLVLFDGQERYVEAPSFAEAVLAWRAAIAVEWGADYDGTEEPESVVLMSDEPVIRAREIPAVPGVAGEVVAGETAESLYERENWEAD